MDALLIIIITLIALQAFVVVIADILNLKRISPKIPNEFIGWYDETKYRRSQEYLAENTRFRVTAVTTKTIIACSFYALGGMGYVDTFAHTHADGNMTLSAIIFAGVLLLCTKIVDLPFSLYHTFVTEQRFGFNKMTPLTYVCDIGKELLLMCLLGAPIYIAIIWFFAVCGSWAWLYCWIAYTAFEIGIMYIAPIIILPMFNKFIPLQEGELKAKIETYAKENDFAISGVFVMDGSKRSARANAFFTGFGRFRKIALFDTLIAQHSADELLAVLAHEVGHFKKKHIMKLQCVSIIVTGVMFALLGLFIDNRALFDAFGVHNVSVYVGLFLCVISISPINILLGVGANVLSRKYEFEADAFSAHTARLPIETFINALKRLSVNNLSNLSPHPLKVALEYTHPPVIERIIRLRMFAPQKQTDAK